MTGNQILLLVAAVSVGAFIKSVTGLGMPLIAVPVASLAINQPIVVAAIAFPNLVQNLALIWQNRVQRRNVDGLGWFVASGLGGALLGAWAVPRLDETVLVGGLVVIVAIYLATSIRRVPSTLTAEQQRRWRVPAGFVTGAFQGSLGISGPLVVAWFQSVQLRRDAFVFAISTAFGTSGMVQVAVYAVQGRLASVWPVSIILLGIVAISIPIGHRVRGRLNAENFRRAVLLLVFATWLLLIEQLTRRILAG